ncbi:MAG: hypothetical protein U0X91_03095 [Spirosomataceae bacterium]
MKIPFFLLVTLFSLLIFSSGFAQGPPLPPGAESPFIQKKVSVAELKKMLIGEWLLESDKNQGLKITATTFANTLIEMSHKAVNYKVSTGDKCSCDFGEMPPPPMLLGGISISNTKNCYLIYEVVEGNQVVLNFGLIDPVKEIVKTFTVVKK